MNLTAAAGTPLSDIWKELERNNQELAFEPVDLGPLLGRGPGEGTLGGLIACNLSGPRRIKAGAARDHFLGFHAVSGRGEEFKSGGKVMKNVTGFDLSKLMAGSFGTLGVMTQATVKVLPKPEKTRTVLIMGADSARAARIMADAMGSAHEVSAAGYLPGALTGRSTVGYVKEAGNSVTALRLEGPGPSVDYRTAALTDMFKSHGVVEELHRHNSETFWAEMRDAHSFTDDLSTQVWRISVPPIEGPAIGAQLAHGLGGEFYCDWQGGLIWLSIPAQPDAAATDVRAAISFCGGHATLIRAAADVRNAVPPFQLLGDAVEGLSARIKNGFDPNGVLNPGRMYKGV